MSTETVSKKLFTLDEYHRMGEAGILPQTGRFELIRGEIIEIAMPGSAHSGRVNRLNRLFTSKLGDFVIVSVQNPVALGVFSEPLPDSTLLKPRPDFYTERHPGPEDILLAVEVSDTTLKYDSGTKAALYAEFGIPEYWVLDVIQDVLIVRMSPSDRQYLKTTVFRRGETLRPQKLQDTLFSADEILG
jgi:Uma2 family endonuclease